LIDTLNGRLSIVMHHRVQHTVRRSAVHCRHKTVTRVNAGQRTTQRTCDAPPELCAHLD
jgi:hypothetical protein